MITKKQTKLRDRIIKEGVYSVRMLQKIDKIHFLTISKELGIDYSEITKYYASMEDIFHLQQIKNWKATYKVLDKKVKEVGYYNSDRKQGKWIKYDDSTVTEVDEKDIAFKKCYIYLYEKRYLLSTSLEFN